MMIKRLAGGYVPPFTNEQGKVLHDSVSLIEKINLGGADQWVTIRGKNKKLPILLFLHGGPGSPQTGAQQKYNSELEEHYIVVNWDQRGSGKSFTAQVTPESMTFNQLLEDAYELVGYLLKKFGAERIFLMGHSVGAALGLLFAHRHPDLLHAYIGINQPIDRSEEERRSYEFVWEKASQHNSQNALNQLEKIGPPKNGVYNTMEDMVTQRKWLTKFKGVTYKKNAVAINMHYLLSTHLTLKEKLTFMKGFSFTASNIWGEGAALNFFSLVPEVKVPIFLIAGQHDRIVFLDLVKEYYQFVKAPDKQLIIFEQSGHLACFEEAKRFNDVMIQQVLPYSSIRQWKGRKPHQ